MNRLVRPVPVRLPVRLILALSLLLTVVLAALSAAPAQAQSQPELSTVTIRAEGTVVYEGGVAAFTVIRTRSQRPADPVLVKTWEPNHEDSSGQNVTERIHEVWFGSAYRTRSTQRIPVYIDNSVDVGVLELKAQVLPSADGSYIVGSIDTATDSRDTATVEVVDVQGSTPTDHRALVGPENGR